MSINIETAQTLYREKQYAKALEIYKSLLEREPKNDSLMIMIGNCYDGQGNKTQALKWYQKAYHLNRNSVVILNNLTTSYYEMENYNQATKYAQKTLQIDSQNLVALTNLGNIAYRQKDFLHALQAYRQAWKKDSHYYIAAVNIANTSLDCQDYEQAKEFARYAITLVPDSVMAWTILGNACNETEDYEEATHAYQQAIKLDSQDPWLYNYLSQVWQKRDNWSQAFACGWKAVELSLGADEQQINFGYLLYESTLNKHDSVLQKYANRWLEKYPQNKVAQHMGNAVLNQNVCARANDEYVKNIFDAFAPDFEKVLTDLEYQAPQHIAQYLTQIYTGSKLPRLKILDAGCGTGFCGEFLKKYSKFRGLYGVDISENMLAQARKKHLYSYLYQDELEHYFSIVEEKFDLIVSADVFTYFGDLEKLFSGIFSALKENGYAIFTVSENSITDDDYFLHASGRYLHHKNYIRRLLKHTYFQEQTIERVKLRNEGNDIVWGYLVSAKKPQKR